MTGFKKPQLPDCGIAVDTRTGSFVWLSMAIQNLLNCDGLLPSPVNGAYWKLSYTGGSVGFPCRRWWHRLALNEVKPNVYRTFEIPKNPDIHKLVANDKEINALSPCPG